MIFTIVLTTGSGLESIIKLSKTKRWKKSQQIIILSWLFLGSWFLTSGANNRTTTYRSQKTHTGRSHQRTYINTYFLNQRCTVKLFISGLSNWVYESKWLKVIAFAFKLKKFLSFKVQLVDLSIHKAPEKIN